MRRLVAVTLLGCCATFSARAQHGGGSARMGGGSSVHMGGGSGFRGGFAGAPHGGFPTGARAGAFRPSGPGVFRPGFGYRAAPRSYPGAFGRRSGFPGNFHGRYPSSPGRYPVRGGFRGRRYPFYPGYAFAGPLNFGYVEPFWDFADTFGDDPGFYDAPPSGSYGDPPGEPYAAEAAPYSQQPTQPDSSEAGDSNPPLVYAPYAYSQPRKPGGTLPAPQREEDAVTLFFRDGRPPEQIRNYALTRHSLLIAGPHMREIPLDDLDLPLTERVNRAAGVEFQLPQSNGPAVGAPAPAFARQP